MWRKICLWVLACTIVSLAWIGLQHVREGEAAGPRVSFEGIRIELTRDFYDALMQDSGSGSRTYSNDPRHEYLRRIAVSGEFAVKTNLTIIQQQEKIIELLEALNKQGQQQR